MIKKLAFALLLFFTAECQAKPPIRIAVGIDPNIHVKGLTFQEIRECVREAQRAWEDVANVDFYYDRYPDLLVVDAPLRPGRVAECDVRARRIRFDGENAVTGIEGGYWTRSFFTRVMIHELGHALGLDHVDGRREPDSIMKDRQPLPSKPGEGDIIRLYYLYEPKED